MDSASRANGQRIEERLDFQSIFDAVPGLYVVLLPNDPVYTIAAVNRAYAQATLTVPDEIIGRGLFEVFPDNPEDRQASGVLNLHASLREVLASKARHTMAVQKYDIQRPDSSGGGFEARYWSPINSPVLGSDGEVQFIIHRVEDVTELVRLKQLEGEHGKLANELRGRADEMEAELFLRARQLVEAQRLIRAKQEMEEKLLVSEARFSLAFAEAPIGMVLLTPSGQIIEVNQTYVTMLGYTREEMASHDSSFFTHPEDIEATRLFFDGLRAGPHKTSSFEKRYLRKDGQVLWVRASGTMRRDAMGRPDQVIATVEDITERKRAEERLWESKEQLRAIYDGTYEYIGLLTPEGRVLDCNQASLEFAGNTREDVVGRPFWETPWFAATPGAPEAIRESVARAAAGEFVRYEVPLIRPSGEVFTFDFSLYPVRNERGEVVSLVPEGRNITERKAAEIRDAFLVGLDDAARPLSDTHAIVDTVGRLLGEHLRVNRCAYVELEPDENTFTVTGDYTVGIPSMAGRYTATQFSDESLRLLRDGKAWVVEDSEIDPRVAAVIDTYRRASIRSVICVPLLKAGRLVAAMAVNQATPRRWRQNEIELVQLAASRCWESIERVRAAADLQQQWHSFDTALSNTPDFAYVFNLEGRFTYVNRSLLSLWQRPLEAAIGRNFFDLEYPPELAGRLQSQIQQVIDTRGPVRDTTPFTGPTGETRHYEYILVPVLDANGLVEAVAGSTRDITDQNRAAHQIEEDRRRWRELLLQTPAGIAVLRGPDYRFEWVNSEYTRLVGRSEQSLLGKTVLDTFPEVEGQIYVELLDNVFRTGEPFIGHDSLLRLDRGDGILHNIYVNFVYAATRDVTGQIDGIFVHVTDVTDMVLARKRLEESETQFRTLAESIPHLAWMADEQGNRFWYNRRWYDYTGTTFEEVKDWGWGKVHDASVLPQVMERWQEALKSGEPFEMIYPLKGANGLFRTFLTRTEPVKDSQGRVARWFGTNTDISDQRAIEDELRRTNRELEEFAYVASHDLQEPLRMVNIYTQQILRAVGSESGASDEKLTQYSAFVRQGVMRMETLIRDLLTFSRTVQKDELPLGTADLPAALSEALSVLKERIDETGALVRTLALPQVRGDTSQIAHVFQNVISNSLKYRKISVIPEIDIAARREGDQWIISIADNGIGFEPRFSERIFGLFKRLHKDQYPGTGLGLAICKRIVERYGGRMWAEGQPGGGATFYFALQCADGQ